MKPQLIRRRPQLLTFYQEFLESKDTANLVARIARSYTVETLERLAFHGDFLVRRASALALGLMADVGTTEVLGGLLSDEDRMVRLVADDSLKAIWGRTSTPSIRQQLEMLSRRMDAEDYASAIEMGDRLLAQGSIHPEVFGQRGLARFYLDDCHGAISDCRKALDIHPYYYPAWIGMGHAYLELAEPLQALDCFRHALRVYPDLELVRVQVRRLEKAFREPG